MHTPKSLSFCIEVNQFTVTETSTEKSTKETMIAHREAVNTSDLPTGTKGLDLRHVNGYALDCDEFLKPVPAEPEKTTQLHTSSSEHLFTQSLFARSPRFAV